MFKQCPTGQTRKACLVAKCFDEQVYREIVFWLMRWGFYTVTAREAHLCDERGSPAADKVWYACRLGMPRKAGAYAGSPADGWKLCACGTGLWIGGRATGSARICA